MRIISNFLLKKITSMAVGGPALYYVEVKNERELERALEYAELQKLNKYIIGDATNIIPDDRGFKGLVIRSKIKKFEVGGDVIYLGAGNNLTESILKLNKLGWGGFEKMAGIPGTVGGAIYGCAGAYGQEIKDRLGRVKIFSNTDGLHWLSKRQCRFGYRDSILKRRRDWIIVGAEFGAVRINSAKLQKTSVEIMRLRNKIYPIDLRCPGSFFKNIVVNSVVPISLKKNILVGVEKSKIKHGKIPAAYFLEQVGGKGMRVGSIAVADYHANLIYNLGGGRTEDIKKLTALLKSAVYKKFGIKLEEEVQYL